MFVFVCMSKVSLIIIQVSSRIGLIVRRLTIVCFPCTFPELHICEDCCKGRVFRRTSIDAKSHSARTFMDMADAHLMPLLPILGTFHTIVIFAARKAIPHHFLTSRDSGCCPIAITMIGNYASQMLELIVLILYRCFQPILAVKIHHHTALVKACMATTKIGSYHEREKLLFCLHLKDRGVIVAEMVVSALP